MEYVMSFPADKAELSKLRAGDKLKRSEAEKVAGNLPSASVFGIILTAVALIAEGITAYCCYVSFLQQIHCEVG